MGFGEDFGFTLLYSKNMLNRPPITKPPRIPRMIASGGCPPRKRLNAVKKVPVNIVTSVPAFQFEFDSFSSCVGLWVGSV